MYLFCRFVLFRSLLSVVLIFFLLSCRILGQTQLCPDPPPNPPVPGITISAVPADVCIPKNCPTNQNPIAFFDDYSWKTFITMVWPAKTGQRGTPDAAKNVGDISGLVVFETLKQDWELFQPDGAPPSSNWADLGIVGLRPSSCLSFHLRQDRLDPYLHQPVVPRCVPHRNVTPTDRRFARTLDREQSGTYSGASVDPSIFAKGTVTTCSAPLPLKVGLPGIAENVAFPVPTR
jgi:hypothetical protein